MHERQLKPPEGERDGISVHGWLNGTIRKQRSPIAYPQVLKTFAFPLVITVVLPYHHLDLGSIQGIHLPQLCHTVGCNHHAPLAHQSPTAHQLPVRSLIVVASSCSTVPLQGPCLAVCLVHLCPNSVGGAAVDGCQPRPVSLRWPL